MKAGASRGNNQQQQQQQQQQQEASSNDLNELSLSSAVSDPVDQLAHAILPFN